MNLRRSPTCDNHLRDEVTASGLILRDEHLLCVSSLRVLELCRLWRIPMDRVALRIRRRPISPPPSKSASKEKQGRDDRKQDDAASRLTSGRLFARLANMESWRVSSCDESPSVQTQ
jgi:hypothetical protein